MLTLFCSGKSIDSLLENEAAQKKTISLLTNIISRKGGDGVCIDFEGASPKMNQAFQSFILNLKTAFKKRKLLVSITLPAINDTRLNFNLMNQDVDLYILMGYGYFGKFSPITGPMSPLENRINWINQCVTQSVTSYLKNNVPDSMLLLGVPYYGAIWETTHTKIPAKAIGFVGYRPYNYASELSISNFNYDSIAQSMYYCYPIKDQAGTYRQFWLDGVGSLGAKYDFVLQKKLGGIAIWALGFDYGSTDLENLLVRKFTLQQADSTQKTSGINFPYYKTSLNILKKYPLVLGISIYILLVTLLLVLIKTLSNSQNIAKLKSLKLFYLFMLVVIFILSLNSFVLLRFCFNLSPKLAVSSIGIAILLFFAVKQFLSYKKKDLP